MKKELVDDTIKARRKVNFNIKNMKILISLQEVKNGGAAENTLAKLVDKLHPENKIALYGEEFVLTPLGERLRMKGIDTYQVDALAYTDMPKDFDILITLDKWAENNIPQGRAKKVMTLPEFLKQGKEDLQEVADQLPPKLGEKVTVIIIQKEGEGQAFESLSPQLEGATFVKAKNAKGFEVKIDKLIKEKVKTEYVLFTDSATEWEDGIVERMLEPLENVKAVSYSYIGDAEFDPTQVLNPGYVSYESVIRTEKLPDIEAGDFGAETKIFAKMYENAMDYGTCIYKSLLN